MQIDSDQGGNPALLNSQWNPENFEDFYRFYIFVDCDSYIVIKKLEMLQRFTKMITNMEGKKYEETLNWLRLKREETGRTSSRFLRCVWAVAA